MSAQQITVESFQFKTFKSASSWTIGLKQTIFHSSRSLKTLINLPATLKGSISLRIFLSKVWANKDGLWIFVEVFPTPLFSGPFSEEYLAAAHLKKTSLKHGAVQELLSENEIGEFLKRTNVKNFVVSSHAVFLCSSTLYDVGTYPWTPRFLD